MTQFRVLIATAVLAVFLSFIAFVAQMNKGVIPPEPQNYKGYYFEGLEAPNFYPCDFDEHWEVAPKVPHLSQEYRRITAIQKASTDGVEPIYAELRGHLSDRGNYGHLGLADRKLDVIETVVTSRVYKTDRQCKPGAETWPIVVFEYD